MATLIRKTFNWGDSLTVSEVQSFMIMVRHGSLQVAMVLEKYLRAPHFAGKRSQCICICICI